MKPVSIADYHAAQSRDVKAICDRLREEIDRGLPEADSRIWHAHPVWFLKDNPVVGYSKLKSCVRLMFWSGQSFETPGLKPEGSFKTATMRYTHVTEIEIGRLTRWLGESRSIQWDYKSIYKRKGRLERLL